MNTVERTIAAEMARPMPPRLCTRGCGQPAHHGGCRGAERFAGEVAIRKCAHVTCGNKLAISNPGPLCRPCQAQALQDGMKERERESVAAEPKGIRTARSPAGLRASLAGAVVPPGAPPAGLRTIRIDAIPESADNHLESEIGELFGRLMALAAGEALVIPRNDKRQIRNTCERLRNRLKYANAGRLRWKRDELTLYVWREPLHGAVNAARERGAK